MNQELYNQLLGAAAVMVEAQKCDKAIQQRYSQINNLEYELKIQDEKVKDSKGSFHALTAWGVVLMILGFGNGGMFTFGILAVGLEEGLMEILLDPTVIPLCFFIIILFVLGIVGLSMRNIARIKRKKYIEKLKKESEENKIKIQSKIKKLEAEIEKIKDGLRKFGEENEYLLAFLPVKYRWPDAINFMLQAVENLRADSLKEVINLYEQELHLLEQERILNNNALMQQRYNESILQMAETINYNQERINSNLKFVQTLQLLDIFDD